MSFSYSLRLFFLSENGTIVLSKLVDLGQPKVGEYRVNTTKRYDVLIVGAGVVGCAIARELSRYSLSVGVVEKEKDVSFGTSSRNSGVVHAGFNYAPGSLRAKLDVEGNRLMEPLCRKLKVKMSRIGKLTVALHSQEMPGLEALKEQGEANGVPGLEILDSFAMQKIQPGVEGVGALWSPSSGIVCPYGLTIALARSARQNGVDFYLSWEVAHIFREESGFILENSLGEELKASVVINAAGLFADRMARMVGIDDYTLYPCRGEYYVLDKRLEGTLKTLLYPAPRKNDPGLGIHLTPTVDGNILIGPSAEYTELPEDWACSASVMENLRKKGKELFPDLSASDFIRNFAGLRPKLSPPEEGGNRDFVVEDRQDVPGFINLMGVESPGLTSAPALALMVRDMVGNHLELQEKANFLEELPGREKSFAESSPEERAALVAEDPNYGEMVCRCEQVTKREILDALSDPLGARTLMSIKYRTRATMGRCQGGFCFPKIVNIMTRELGYDPEEISLRDEKSFFFPGRVRKEEVAL